VIYSRKSSRDRVTRGFIRYDLPDGRRKTEFAGDTKGEAKHRLAERPIDLCNGTWRDPHAPIIEPDSGPTFEAFADRFLQEDKPERRSHFREQMLNALKRHFMGRPLREITTEEIDRYRAKCLRRRTAAAMGWAPPPRGSAWWCWGGC
jgi:hypothetical protein